MRYFFSILALLELLFVGCNQQEVKKQPSVYFDLKKYFQEEETRLQNANMMVLKTTSKDGSSETKKVNNIIWKNEFSVFVASDLNKPAWIKSYKVQKKVAGSDTIEFYNALDSVLRTRRMSVTWNKNREIQKIVIANLTRNDLYDLEENLIYIPDTMYQINRNQRAKLLKENRFSVIGRFEK